MAEDPEEVYQRILAEEQGKGSSPAVAEARAKAARHRARKGIPIDPAGAAAAAAAPAPASETPAPAETAPEEPGPEQPGAATQPAAAAVATAAPARGRGAGARAARTGGNGGASPDRIQRLLAVVKPEAIQRVEREPMDRVNVWPHLMASEFVSLLVITVGLMIFSAVINAPFRELANINRTPNPSKAPWYFLGLQELLRYFHAQVAGVTIPQWLIVAFIAAPYIDRNPSTRPDERKVAIVLFSFYVLFFALLVMIGSLFRGPSYEFIYPWTIRIIEIFEF